jgi:hypothetical protein
MKLKISEKKQIVDQILTSCAFLEACWYAKHQELGVDGGEGPPMSCSR